MCSGRNLGRGVFPKNVGIKWLLSNVICMSTAGLRKACVRALGETWTAAFFPWNSSTSGIVQGGGGNFNNRNSVGWIGCCESQMAKRIHYWTDGSLELYPSGICNVRSGHLTITAG